MKAGRGLSVSGSMCGPLGRSSGVPFKVGSGSFTGNGARSASEAFSGRHAVSAMVRAAVAAKPGHVRFIIVLAWGVVGINHEWFLTSCMFVNAYDDVIVSESTFLECGGKAISD